MRRLALLVGMVALVSCASLPLTPAGSGIVAMWERDSGAMLGNCDRLAPVVGNSATIFGGVAGQPQAIADAKNKAAAISGADTVVLTNWWDDFSGSHVNGVAYRCGGASPKTIVVRPETPAAPEATASPPASSKYDDLSKLEQLRASGVLTQEEFEAEKKKILSR